MMSLASLIDELNPQQKNAATTPSTVPVTEQYSADPSANVFNGKLYIYPSHDRDIEMESNDNGDQYAMEDYHVYEMADMNTPPKDLGVILHVDDVPWATSQMWAPSALAKNWG